MASDQRDLEFLAKVSHELRGPLHSILGLSEMLVDGQSGSDPKRLSTAINREAKSLQVLVNDLLDYAKIASDRLDLVLSPFPIVDVVAGTVSASRTSAEAKGLSLLLQVDPKVPLWVMGDEVRFAQIIRNLISNAVRYSDTGNIAVDLSLGSNEHLVCRVADQGIGIAAEAIETLFDPFTQAHAHRPGGSGLGLAICSRLTKLMGGSLSVTSEVGVGSTFVVDVGLQATSAPESQAAPSQTPGGDGQHILVVEDSPVNQLLATSQIEKLGMEPVLLDSGEDALALLATPEAPVFGAILMDWNLPGITGLEAAAMIRSEGLIDEDTPIIAMTANALSGDKERCLQAGMNDFLSKPVSSAEMAAMLGKWVPGAAEVEQGTTPRHNATVDSRTLDELAAEFDDPAIVEGLIGTFLAELPGRISSILEGRDSDDLDQVKRSAHTLGSTSALLGAHGIKRICTSLRDSSDMSAARPLVGRLDLEAKDVADALNIWLRQQGEAK